MLDFGNEFMHRWLWIIHTLPVHGLWKTFLASEKFWLTEKKFLTATGAVHNLRELLHGFR
jgi:hypothetical protein